MKLFDKKKKEMAKKVKKYRPGTEDEYPKKERNAFVEAVGIYNKAHPD